MKGCIPIDDLDLPKVLEVLNQRDRCILIMGIRTGFRISELLSLNLVDVFKDGVMLNSIALKRSNTKGKTEGRTVPMHPELKIALEIYLPTIHWDSERLIRNHPDGIPLFLSKNGLRFQRNNFGDSLRKASSRASIRVEGRIASHSLRKTFAKKIWEASDKDIHILQQALGHKNINNTVKYIQGDWNLVSNLIKNVK